MEHNDLNGYFSILPDDLIEFLLSFLNFGGKLLALASTNKSMFFQIQSCPRLYDLTMGRQWAKAYCEVFKPNQRFDLLKNQLSLQFNDANNQPLDKLIGFVGTFADEKQLSKLNPLVLQDLSVDFFDKPLLLCFSMNLHYLHVDFKHCKKEWDPQVFALFVRLETLELTSVSFGTLHLPQHLKRLRFEAESKIELSIPTFPVTLQDLHLGFFRCGTPNFSICPLKRLTLIGCEVQVNLNDFSELIEVELIHLLPNVRLDDLSLPKLRLLKLGKTKYTLNTLFSCPQLVRVMLNFDDFGFQAASLKVLLESRSLKSVNFDIDDDLLSFAGVLQVLQRFASSQVRFEFNINRTPVSNEMIARLPLNISCLYGWAEDSTKELDFSTLVNLSHLELHLENNTVLKLPHTMNKVILNCVESKQVRMNSLLHKVFTMNPSLAECIIHRKKLETNSDLFHCQRIQKGVYKVQRNITAM